MKHQTCATCSLWQAGPERGTAYMAGCALAERRTQFDEGCRLHQPLVAPPQFRPPESWGSVPARYPTPGGGKP